MSNSTKTELHTHLMGMLSARKLLEFVASFDKNFTLPVDYHNVINFIDPSYKEITIEDIINNYSNINEQAISIHHGDNIPYNFMDNIYFNRSSIIAKLVSHISKTDPSIANPKEVIYTKYLEECLRELISQGVEYVEISFSNNKLIASMLNMLDRSLLDHIDCRFLLSSDRKKQYKDFNQSSRYLEKLINEGYCVGFDVMGAETAITDIEKDVNSNMSIFRKLTPIIDKLHNSKNSTLRIHSGETPVSEYNTALILKILEQVETNLHIQIPPPEIRIGHAIHFINNDEYLRLLKKFKCIIEINASSNYALSNVRSYNNIPYSYYLDNDIDVVLSTDGHGVYDTNIEKENIIAEMVLNNKMKYNKIKDIDEKILNKKR